MLKRILRLLHNAIPRLLHKRIDYGRCALAPLRGSLTHLQRSTDELIALTRGEH